MQTRRISFALTALMFGLGALLLVVTKGSALASGDLITRVSVATDGTQSDDDSINPKMSANGRYIVFASLATNLVASDTNGMQDIFVHDRDAGETTRVSVNSEGVQGDKSSDSPAISSNGRYVVFSSNATNLVPDDTNRAWDVFVHDRTTGETTRVSIASNGEEGDGSCIYSTSAISADGQIVAFSCDDTTLVPDDTNERADVFVHDRVTGETALVSDDPNGASGSLGGRAPALSDDGRYIVFESSSSNLVPNDTNGTWDVFLHDRVSGETSLVSVNSDNVQGNDVSGGPAISRNGRYVVFGSRASNLDPDSDNPANGNNDLFLHDLETGITEQISVAQNGIGGDNGSYYGSISDNGRYVAFASRATNLLPGGVEGDFHVYVKDRETGRVTLVSVSATGPGVDDFSTTPSISGDGRYVAFTSSFRTLIPGDTNMKDDVFVYDGADRLPPSSELEPLPITSPAEIPLSWSGVDDESGGIFVSGVATYDVQARVGSTGEWVPVLAGTTQTSTVYDGEAGHTYYFRARATDAAGNVEAWPATYDESTRVPNIFTGTLNVASGWITTQVVTVSFSGTSAGDPVEAASLSNDETTWGEWIPITPGTTVTTTWDFEGDGPDQGLYLWLRDTSGETRLAAQTYVNIDTVAPTSYMWGTPDVSTSAISLNWAGDDQMSQIASYEVQARRGADGTWTTILETSTSNTDSTIYNAAPGYTYYFRARATDAAGNVEAWPATYDEMTRVPNVFTGTLDLPDGWVTTQTGSISFTGTSAGDPVEEASLSNNGSTWGEWISISPNTPVTTTWNFGSDGANKRVYLRLRDEYGDVGLAVTDTVNVDTVEPDSTLAELPATAPAAISLEWSGSDATSGVAHYDVEVREGATGAWTSLLTNTSSTTAVYSGTNGTTYYFRARATDVAGNVEAWPASHDALTTVDTGAPTGTLSINEGALATAATTVELGVSAEDALSAVSDMRFSDDGEDWDTWQAYEDAATFALPANDGIRTVYAQFRDEVGNLSAPVSDTIELDQAAGTARLLSIDEGAQWTNVPTVTLTIGAPAGTTEMQISNDGGFANATWQPFDTRPTWQLVPYGSDDPLTYNVYVRVRDTSGEISESSQDDIVYDPLPPTGNAVIDSISETSVRVSLPASDPDSGVAEMRVGLADSFGQATWQPYATTRTLPLNGVPADEVEVCVQFRDGAGNTSTRICTTNQAEWSVYLPLIGR
jgi:hypothetical protein